MCVVLSPRSSCCTCGGHRDEKNLRRQPGPFPYRRGQQSTEGCGQRQVPMFLVGDDRSTHRPSVVGSSSHHGTTGCRAPVHRESAQQAGIAPWGSDRVAAQTAPSNCQVEQRVDRGHPGTIGESGVRSDRVPPGCGPCDEQKRCGSWASRGRRGLVPARQRPTTTPPRPRCRRWVCRPAGGRLEPPRPTGRRPPVIPTAG